MSEPEITTGQALMRLGACSAEAVAQVLESLAPGLVARGEVTVFSGQTPFTQLPPGSVAASVSYVDGVTGANVFVLEPAAARALSGAMGAPPPEAEEAHDGDEGERGQEPAPPPLSALELSAVAEAANQMMAAAAAAIGIVLGQEIEISPPDVCLLGPGETDRWGTAPHATSTTFSIDGHSCRLIQLVPTAFVVRMARGLSERSDERPDLQPRPADADARALHRTERSSSLPDALGEVRLRVWAELGRARLPLASTLTLPLGSVVDLDTAADAPVDLYVNGLRFGQGRLLVTEDGEWAVQLLAVANHN